MKNSTTKNLNSEILYINNITISKETNGPGLRVVIWLQGCKFYCNECINQYMWDINKGKKISIFDLIDIIQGYSEIYDIEGITISGGEPLLQSNGLFNLLKEIKKRDSNLSIFLFSGYKYEEIVKNIQNGKSILNIIDILVDGLYEKQYSANLKWRGSSNQKIYFLTNRYKHLENSIDAVKYVEVILSKNSYKIVGYSNKFNIKDI